MIISIIAATILVVVAFASLIALHLRTMNRLKAEYDKALDELSAHPQDAEAEVNCRIAGRSYYRYLHIREHATLSDFPLPYVETNDLDDELISRDIAKKTAVSHEHTAA
jgi:hypothetical protein